MTDQPETYVVLMRGINVGGKNRIRMAELKDRLEEEGFARVLTHIQSGNVVLQSALPADAVAAAIERLLPARFTLDSPAPMVVALGRAAFARIVCGAPPEFGADDAAHRYYVLFLKDIGADAAMREIEVRPGIDTAWQGEGAIYCRIPSLASGLATRSWLNRVIEKPIYRRITMRNWKTTNGIMAILDRSPAA